MGTVCPLIVKGAFSLGRRGCRISERQILDCWLQSGTCQSVADTFQCERFNGVPTISSAVAYPHRVVLCEIDSVL